MKEETFLDAMGNIEDELIEKAEHYKKTKRTQSVRLGVLAACLCLTLTLGILSTTGHLWKTKDGENHAGNSNPTEQTEDMLAIDPSIRVNGKQYAPITEEQITRFGLSQTVTQEQLGEQLGQTTDGKLVYAFTPVGCEAVVAVNNNGQLGLCTFLAFESYLNNQDEDMVAYLKLYGINNAQDLKRVTIGERELPTDKIPTFYNYFAILKDSSNAYFQSLTTYQGPDETEKSESASNQPTANVNMPTVLAPDDSVSGSTVTANPGTVAGSVPGSKGTTALENSRSIMIYACNGLSFEMPYYPNIDFISRHAVGSDFRTFLQQYL